MPPIIGELVSPGALGLKKGAIGCTTNCENQNLVVIGAWDQEIVDAISTMIRLGGGFIAVADGKAVGSIRLKVAGCSNIPLSVLSLLTALRITTFGLSNNFHTSPKCSPLDFYKKASNNLLSVV
jgi:hypothetical protein